MASKGGPDIVENGLTLFLDASNVRSYPGSGTTWTDLSGNGNNFSLINGPTFSAANLGSIVFDGVDDYLQISSLVWDYNNNFTTQFWFTPSSLGGANGYGLFFNGTTSLNTNRVQIAGTSDGSIYLNTVGSTVGDNFVSAAGLVSVGNWYNFAAVRSSGVITVYLNGVSVASGNVNYAVSQQSNLYVGFVRSSGALWYLNGRMSSILINNRSLSVNEVLQNYNATKSRFGR
jgi:hypothetical protein